MKIKASLATRLSDFVKSAELCPDSASEHISWWKSQKDLIYTRIYTAIVHGKKSCLVDMGTLSGTLWSIVKIFLEDDGYVVEPYNLKEQRLKEIQESNVAESAKKVLMKKLEDDPATHSAWIKIMWR